MLRNIGGVKLNDQPGDLASGQGIFNGAGLAKRMVSQGVRVYEVAFWDPTPTDELARTSRAPSCPEFIDGEYHTSLVGRSSLIIRSRGQLYPTPSSRPHRALVPRRDRSRESSRARSNR